MIEIKNALGVWVPIPPPSVLTIGVNDISDAKRTASGNMVIDHINRKQKLELEWKYLSKDNLKTLLTLIDPTAFEVRYTDPQTDALVEKRFYKGNRKIPVLRWVYDEDTGTYYTDYSDVGVNFIEL